MKEATILLIFLSLLFLGYQNITMESKQVEVKIELTEDVKRAIFSSGYHAGRIDYANCIFNGNCREINWEETCEDRYFIIERSNL